MALRISRRSTDCGRPPGLGLGIRGWTSFHWASVRSVGYFARLIPFSTPKTRGEVHFSHRLLGPRSWQASFDRSRSKSCSILDPEDQPRIGSALEGVVKPAIGRYDLGRQ